MMGPACLLENPTRILLFTGKGGVGKTSLACATAVALADRGERVLLVSTDPASNLDEVLETRLGSEPKSLAKVSWSVGPEHRSRWLPLALTGSASSARTAEFCRRPQSPAWKSSCPALAPWRLRLSTSSRSSWATQRRLQIRPHSVRHRADRSHTPAPESSRGLGRIHGGQLDRHFVPGAIGGLAGTTRCV